MTKTRQICVVLHRQIGLILRSYSLLSALRGSSRFRRRNSKTRRVGRNWWSRRLPDWRIKFWHGRFRFAFDLHRAGGLWLWAALFVFAWSSVFMNLVAVYGPIMRVFGYTMGEGTVNIVPFLYRVHWALALFVQGDHRANTVTRWLEALHMANVWGLPYRVAVAVLGLLTVALAITGVIIWARKRSARVRTRSRSSQYPIR